jgi:LuxR family transcriptional regulator, quorum-sensing system regulator SdiA
MPERILGQLVEKLSTAGSAGFAIALHLNYTSPRYMLQSYPTSWSDRYARNGYLMMDPTVHWGLENEGWIRWSNLTSYDTAGLFAEAAEHGLHYGVTSVILARGSRSIASFSRSDQDYTDDEAKGIHDKVGELHDLTLQVHALPPALHDLLRRLSIILTQH